MEGPNMLTKLVTMEKLPNMLRFHKIKELVSSSELLLEKIHTFENAADMLTKLVTTEKFKHCLDLINISRCYMGDAPTYCPRWSFKPYLVSSKR